MPPVVHPLVRRGAGAASCVPPVRRARWVCPGRRSPLPGRVVQGVARCCAAAGGAAVSGESVGVARRGWRARLDRRGGRRHGCGIRETEWVAAVGPRGRGRYGVWSAYRCAAARRVMTGALPRGASGGRFSPSPAWAPARYRIRRSGVAVAVAAAVSEESFSSPALPMCLVVRWGSPHTVWHLPFPARNCRCNLVIDNLPAG